MRSIVIYIFPTWDAEDKHSLMILVKPRMRGGKKEADHLNTIRKDKGNKPTELSSPHPQCLTAKLFEWD